MNLRYASLAGLILAFALAGCGADGPPKPPPQKTGVSISGQVKVGVSGGS
jgi:predicted small lipoprotein YifL